jgi:hypothetical protein
LKRKERLAVNFVNSEDTTQVPIDRKMLKELGAEHQRRPKRVIEKGYESMRSMYIYLSDISYSTEIRLLDFSSRRRTCPKAIRLGKGIQLRHLRNSKSLPVGLLSLPKAEWLMMDDQPRGQ